MEILDLTYCPLCSSQLKVEHINKYGYAVKCNKCHYKYNDVFKPLKQETYETINEKPVRNFNYVLSLN